LGNAATPMFTVGGLTLSDTAGVGGIATVSINSQATTTGAVNTISQLTDNNLATLTVSGTAGLMIGGTLTTNAPTFTINATETGTATNSVVTIADLNDVTLTTLAFTGVATTTIGAMATLTGTSFTITDSDTGAVSITAGDIVDAATLTFTNSGAGSLVIGSLTAASAATIDLNGSVGLTLIGDSVATGVTVAGGTDNAKVSLTFTTGATGTHTDTITLGNGIDTITLGAGAAGATEIITLGNGGTSVAANHFSTVNLLASASTATVTVGTGVNLVETGTGLDNVTFGAHSPSVTAYDTLSVGQTAASFTIATTNSQTAINANALDVIKGLVAGDTLSFANIANLTGAAAGGDGGASAVVSGSAANGLGGVNAEVTFAHGTYSGGNFTLSATGTDTLVTYDAGNTAAHHFVSVVLVGYDYNAATLPAALTGSTIVLH